MADGMLGPVFRESLKILPIVACRSICQSGGKVLVASATPGGTMTDEESGSSGKACFFV